MHIVNQIKEQLTASLVKMDKQIAMHQKNIQTNQASIDKLNADKAKAQQELNDLASVPVPPEPTPEAPAT